MKILTWNVNGYKSAYERGDLKKILNLDYDIICLQEVKNSDIESIKLTSPKSYKTFFNQCSRRGHNGVAILSKIKEEKLEQKIDYERFDKDGRFLKLSFKNFVLYNIYMVHGGRKKENLEYKLNVCTLLQNLIKKENKDIIIATDFNIAHNEIDLARPKQNHKNIMFTDSERDVIDKLLNSNLIDAFRVFNNKEGLYTWFPYSFDARNRNLGWRIDYFFVSQNLKNKIQYVKILNDIYGSDHLPVEINIKL